jgi:hypothetical protein
MTIVPHDIIYNLRRNVCRDSSCLLDINHIAQTEYWQRILPENLGPIYKKLGLALGGGERREA